MDRHQPVRLIAIADAPTVPWPRLRAALEALRASACAPSVLVLDRDVPPALGGPGDRRRLARLRTLRQLLHGSGARLGVTGRVDLAIAAGADAIQLPERGLSVAQARAVAGDAVRIGRSCHDRCGLARATADGADWATLSPVRRPWTKPASRPPLGVDGVRHAIAGLDLPVFALGGVSADLAPSLHRAGAAGIAGIGAVFGVDADEADGHGAFLARVHALIRPWSAPARDR